MSILPDRHLIEYFKLGTTYSEPIEVLPNMKVVFRLLTVEELIEVSEIVAQYTGLEARTMVSQVQTLSRAIVEINQTVLMLPSGEADIVAKQLNKDVLTRVEQAAYMLMAQFPKPLLDELNISYLTFYEGVLGKFETIKKKLKPPSKKEK